MQSPLVRQFALEALPRGGELASVAHIYGFLLHTASRGDTARIVQQAVLFHGNEGVALVTRFIDELTSAASQAQSSEEAARLEMLQTVVSTMLADATTMAADRTRAGS